MPWEESAPRAYQRIASHTHHKLELISKGFLISKKKPFLSASVDNIQKCQCSDGCPNKVLEHKCPWKQNNMHPKEVCLTPKIGDIVSENGFTLKPSSQFYFQLQLQMFVSELPLNVWVVWTEQGVFTFEVPFNPNFMTKVFVVKCFHTKIYFLDLLWILLCIKWVVISLPLRHRVNVTIRSNK